MRHLSLVAILATFFISIGALAQSRSFHVQELVLDNGNNTKTSTLFYAGASVQTLDLTNISTNADTLLLGLNLDLQNNNITNGGNAFLASVTASGNINSTAGVIQTNGTTRIDNSGNGTFGTVAATGNINSSGGTLQTNGATRIDNSGNGTFGTVSATGNINSSGGTLQTNGVTRIDNSGNGTFGTVAATGNINSFAGVIETNGVTRIDNSGNATFGALTTTGAIKGNFTQVFVPLYSIGANDYIVNLPLPVFNVTLPASAGNAGRILIITSRLPGFTQVIIQGTDIISGHGTSFFLNNTAMFTSDGAGSWYIVSSN